VTKPDHRAGWIGSDVVAGADEARNLKLRVASAAVLAPAVLVATYAGGWIFLALCVAAAGGMLWEWTTLVTHRADPRILAPGLVALLSAAILVSLAAPAGALSAIVVGAVLAAFAAVGGTRGAFSSQRAAWAAGGVVYAGAALLAPALLRGDPRWGFTALLFLFATVWLTDIFAFFCGRSIGGPLLWPRVSPKKTWSGAIGGLFGGVAAGVAVAYTMGIGRLGIIGIMALLLSVVAQAGDLFESAVKRGLGAKDASQLIPGHGGLMDRLDGFLFAAVAALLIGLFHQGTAAPAQGLLVW
jgi:phosphatidate cytidylyltransferase